MKEILTFLIIGLLLMLAIFTAYAIYVSKAPIKEVVCYMGDRVETETGYEYPNFECTWRRGTKLILKGGKPTNQREDN